jgi:type I restriction enzyme S subunit
VNPNALGPSHEDPDDLLERFEKERGVVADLREELRRMLASALPEDLITGFDTLAEAQEGTARLRELILQLAVRGRLVPQDPEGEPASKLLARIAVERQRAIEEGEAPKSRRLPDIPSSPTPQFEVPAGWAWTLLDDLCVYIQRGKSPKYDDSSAIRVVSQKCVQWAGFDLAPARGIAEDTLAQYGPERFLRKGDLLWNSTGTGTVGRVNVYPGSTDGSISVADSHVTVVRAALVNPQYLYCWIASPAVQGRIEDMTTGTTKQQELATGTVRGLAVPLPPLAEQHRIVSRVDDLMGLLDRLEQHLTSQKVAHDAFAAAAVHHAVEQTGVSEKPLSAIG